MLFSFRKIVLKVPYDAENVHVKKTCICILVMNFLWMKIHPLVILLGLGKLYLIDLLTNVSLNFSLDFDKSASI